jgi:CRISPR/Cas system-associated exonuclease Cas4 (RecB family)
MAQRVQSPSSINTYRQCPRKYFYNYIQKLPTIKSIHLIRGKMVHSVLENFFKLNISSFNEEHIEFELNVLLQSMFKDEWQKSRGDLIDINLGQQKLEFYYNESQEMLNTWFESLLNRIRLKQNNHMSFVDAFNLLKPETEIYFKSEKHQVQGFIDAVHNINGEVSLIDYKTSKKNNISDDYKLQLAIYALLYFERYGKHPNLVGIDFLKHGLKYMKVDEGLLELARQECSLIQENTKSENIQDYPMKTSPLCKWSTGQCDFYDICFGQKKLEDFK